MNGRGSWQFRLATTRILSWWRILLSLGDPLDSGFHITRSLCRSDREIRKLFSIYCTSRSGAVCTVGHTRVVQTHGDRHYSPLFKSPDATFVPPNILSSTFHSYLPAQTSNLLLTVKYIYYIDCECSAIIIFASTHQEGGRNILLNRCVPIENSKVEIPIE